MHSVLNVDFRTPIILVIGCVGNVCAQEKSSLSGTELSLFLSMKQRVKYNTLHKDPNELCLSCSCT
jgi:hypothetical protein